MLGTDAPQPDRTESIPTDQSPSANKQADKVLKVDPLLENNLLECLCDPSLTFPIDSVQLTNSLSTEVSISLVLSTTEVFLKFGQAPLYYVYQSLLK